MSVIKFENDIPTNIRDIILFTESYLLKNKYYRFGVALNHRRLSVNTKKVREKAGFNLLYHIQNQDKSGRTEGCGCLYCQIHHQYVRYHSIYLNIRRRYDKLQAVSDRPELAEMREVLPMSLNPKVIAGYKDNLSINREKYMKYRTVRKKIAKSFKIPKECR